MYCGRPWSRPGARLRPDQDVRDADLALEAKAWELGARCGARGSFAAAEMLADPQFAADQALIEVDSPPWDRFKVPNSFPKRSDTQVGICSLAPAKIGQNNDSIYFQLFGFDVEIEQLNATGSI